MLFLEGFPNPSPICLFTSEVKASNRTFSSSNLTGTPGVCSHTEAVNISKGISQASELYSSCTCSSSLKLCSISGEPKLICPWSVWRITYLIRTGCSEKHPNMLWVEFSPSPGGADSQQDVLQGCQGARSSKNSSSEQHVQWVCRTESQEGCCYFSWPPHSTTPRQSHPAQLLHLPIDVLHHHNVRKKRSIQVKQEIVHTERALLRLSESSEFIFKNTELALAEESSLCLILIRKTQ